MVSPPRGSLVKGAYDDGHDEAYWDERRAAHWFTVDRVVSVVLSFLPIVETFKLYRRVHPLWARVVSERPSYFWRTLYMSFRSGAAITSRLLSQSTGGRYEAAKGPYTTDSIIPSETIGHLVLADCYLKPMAWFTQVSQDVLVSQLLDRAEFDFGVERTQMIVAGVALDPNKKLKEHRWPARKGLAGWSGDMIAIGGFQHDFSGQQEQMVHPQIFI
jgi:hypothetical protein